MPSCLAAHAPLESSKALSFSHNLTPMEIDLTDVDPCDEDLLPDAIDEETGGYWYNEDDLKKAAYEAGLLGDDDSLPF